MDEDVPPTLAVDGNNIRVFWYNGTSIMYHASADKGANWGGATTALAVANVIYIAAVSTTKVHYATLTSKNNTRLGLIEDTGSWAASNSYIWWPFEPTSFDAVTWGQHDDGAAASNDIIAMTCDFPPLTRIRVDGDEIVRNLERVQGIALFRYQNGLWSHHRTYDMIDNVESGLIPARQGLRLTTYDDDEPWIFMTYNRVSGTENYPHKCLAISRSRTGLHWEMPYLIPAYKSGTCAPLVVNGDYCYLVDSTGRKARSIVVGYLDSSNTTKHDLSANVLSIDVTSGDAKNVQVTLANPNGELDDTINATKMWRMFVKLGWYVDDIETNITTTTAFLDTVSQSRIIPTDHYILSGRDALGRSISTRADEVQEWDHTQITGDNFAQMDDTAYSGMRNTAAFTGFWETAGGVLILKESENTGIAFNIKTSYVWNGGARCAVQVAATDTDDLGGVIFRALDHENFWYCVYDADNDRLVLAERKENTDTLYGQKTSMGWSISTWYYIDVEYSYNYISVYAGTSPANLALQFQHEVSGVPDGTAFTFDNIPLMEGSQGYYGHGYSEYSPSYPSFPTPPPIDLPTQELLGWGATYDHLYYTADFPTPGSGTQPIWTTLTEVGDFDSGDIDTFGVDPLRPDYYKYCYFWVSPTVGYISKLDESDTGSGEWEEVLSNTDVQTAGDLFLHADADLSHMKVDPITGYVWAIAYYSTAGYHIIGFYKSEDRGVTWTLTDTYEDNSNRLSTLASLDAFNDVVVLAANPTGVHSRMLWTVDGGTTWNNHHLNTPAWGDEIMRVGLHPATYDTKVYYYEEYDIDTHANICTFTYGTTTRTELLDVHAASGYDAVVQAHPVFWFNYDDEDAMLIIVGDFTDDSYYVWVTDDNWSTYTEYEPLIEDVNGTVEQVFYTDPSLYESVVYGGYDFPIGIPTHILGGVTSLSDETVAGVCGDNSDTPPYTNSIPNDEIITWVGSVYFHYSNLLGTNLWDGLYT